MAERIGLPDGASTCFELAILAGLGAVVVGRYASRRTLDVARPLVAVAATPILGLVILTASFASIAILAGADHGASPRPGSHAVMMETGASR